jgi:tRNA1Val (adenine37-N6)-methyltransferase
MGNPYFRFKQFEIRQDRCAMKVSTDACIFGAWLAAQRLPVSRVLDIGCGTGLLTAMLAQQWDAHLTGIDIDPDAARQAVENMAACPWNERLQIQEGDVRNHGFKDRFDCIVTNPPFYEQQWESEDQRVNLARHSSHLTLDELLQAVTKNLLPGGYLAILLPFERGAAWTAAAEKQALHLARQLDLKQTPRHGFFRSCMLFREGFKSAAVREELEIMDGEGNYSPAAESLLKPYYLYL